jgi:hypothetical protein
MKKLLIVTIMLMLGILASFGQGSVRPPVESTKVTAINELDARKTITWRGDSLDKYAFAYVEWDANCFRFRRITTGAAWSSWICAEDGESTSIAANAQDVLELIGAAIAFKVQGKHSVLQSDENNNFRFKGNLVLNSKNTVLGSEAGILGYDSLFIGSDTLLVAKFDSTYVNTVLIGHNAKAVGDSTVVLGDETIKQVHTGGAFNGSGFLLEGDTVYLQHLVNLTPADSGKIAMNNGAGVVWIDQKSDSIMINGEWVKLGESLTLTDSIQINGVWVQFGGTVTTPDEQNLSWDGSTGALGISGGTGVNLDGRYLTAETPQNLSWNPTTGALGIDGGTGVDLDGRYLIPPTATDGQIMVKAGTDWVSSNLPIDSIYVEAMGLWVHGGDTIASTCGCSGASGTFYSNEGKLITVENGLIKSIGEQVIGGYWTFKTTSTSSTWTPELVSNSGTILHWEVTGAVTASADANYPVFDFSNVGEKVVTVTNVDGMDGLHSLDLRNKEITEFNSDKLTNLASLNLGSNNLTTFEATGMEGLVVLTIDANQLPSSVVNSILDSLISIGNGSGISLDLRNQTGGGCGDLAKIQALDAIWDEVMVDTCAVESWTYEGVMTVGDTTEFGDYFTGYRLGGNGNYGSIFPDLNFTYDLGSMSWGSPSNVDAGLFVYFFNGGSPVLTVDSITLYVDGIEYELEYDSENGVHLNASVLLDPFPPAGQTCEIKLRYTLAP